MSTLKERFDFRHVTRRLSTWLGLLSTMAISGLGAYAMLPQRAQELFPDVVLLILGAVAVGSGLLIPLATSYKQPGLRQ